jgi:hypothetical protein
MDLDDHFDTIYKDANTMFSDLGPALAENTCRRMADIDMYAKFVSDALGHENPYQAATITASLLVGYFSACKSLLDAVSIALAELYTLPLSNKEKDFTKHTFWRELKKANPNVHDRFEDFKSFFAEVVRWRDSAVHRFTPLVICHSPDRPNRVPRDKVKVNMVADPDTDIRKYLTNLSGTKWIDPLSKHTKWRNVFLSLCKEICTDIQSKQK